MNNEHTVVDIFIEKYNFFVVLKSAEGLNDFITLHAIFEDWVYFELENLEKLGYIILLQYDDEGKEYEYPRFKNNFNNRVYDLHGLLYIDEGEMEYEH